MTTKFKLSIPTKCITHMEDISFYDHNYYKLQHYGDWFSGELDILYQEYSECENCYSYALGKMINENFKGFVYWTITENILNEN